MEDVVWVDPHTLVPHPERELAGSVFQETDGKFQWIQESIQTDGITEALKVQSGTNVIISGHTRRRIALGLNIPKVPVQYYGVDDDEARYMMVTENHKRIGDEKDPIKLAWTFQVVVEAIGLPRGRVRHRNETQKRKTQTQIAESFGMKETHFKRHLALLRLIPELRALVSELKIGVKAGSLLSRLSSENQRKVFESIPPDDLKKPDWRLTENEAKNLVKVYEPTRLQAEDDSENFAPTENGVEPSDLIEVFEQEINDDFYSEESEITIGDRVNQLENGGVRDHSAPDRLEISLAANQFVERPNRKKVMSVAESVDLGYGEKGLSATKKVEDSAKQIARQLVLMEDVDKRTEYVKTQLAVALDKQFNWVERIDTELIPLRVLVADQLDAELAMRWMELCEQMERVYKKLNATVMPVEPGVEVHE